MRFKGWTRTELALEDPTQPAGRRTVTAIAPVIVSASRSTDIPAFYGDWLVRRLAEGYVRWESPFGGRPVYVSFAKTRVFAFWSKNPAPFLRHFTSIEKQGFGSFFLMTLNDYQKEGLEPGVPPLEERIGTFIRLSQKTGPGRITWRYDPLLLSDTITVDDLLGRIRRIGDRIHPYTRRLVFSFIDIARYTKVRRNLAAAGYGSVREFSNSEAEVFAAGLASLNERWGLSLSACGERRDLTRFGIAPGQCIGYELLRDEFPDDPVLQKFLHLPQQELPGNKIGDQALLRYFKDPGQRSACGCVVSKDIGQYSTCPHGCLYCYANSSVSCAERNYDRYLREAERGIFHETIAVENEDRTFKERAAG